MEMIKGWKTVIFNILAAILPVLEVVDLTDVLGDSGMAIYGAVIAGINLVLRSLTDTPIFKGS